MATQSLLLVIAFALTSLAPAAEARAQAPGAGSALASPALVDDQQRLGPFRIDGQDFTVVLRLKRLSQARTAEDAALSALEIHDRSGVIQYRETFTYTVDAGAFSDSCMASAQLLKGGIAAGLLINVGCLPSAPGSGEVWQLFGLHDGKLIRFGKPFTANGDFLDLIPTPPRKIGQATLFLPDVMRFRVWTGNFRVTATVRVDWMQGRLMPGPALLRADGARAARDRVRSSGRGRARAERPGADVRPPLPRDVRGHGRPAAHRRQEGLEVEILAAKIKLSWNERNDVAAVEVDDQDPWLKVRIDGTEGWIHTQEDFNAIGIPQAG